MADYSALGQADYAQAITNLFPRGRAWRRFAGALLHLWRQGAAAFAASFHAAATALVYGELFPDTAQALLPDWEYDFGLPDACTPSGQTVDQRRAALLSRITDPGGLNAQRYIDLAAANGFDITVTEFRPFTCESACDDPVCDDSWRPYWRVNAASTTVFEMRCGFSCGDALRSWGNDELECLINSRNRASRVVLFAYG